MLESLYDRFFETNENQLYQVYRLNVHYAIDIYQDCQNYNQDLMHDEYVYDVNVLKYKIINNICK